VEQKGVERPGRARVLLPLAAGDSNVSVRCVESVGKGRKGGSVTFDQARVLLQLAANELNMGVEGWGGLGFRVDRV